MMTRQSMTVTLSALFAVSTLASLPLGAQRIVADAGVAQVGWLTSKNWGPSIGAQLSALRSERTALIVSARSVFGLETRGTGFVRNDVVGTAALGLEQQVARASKATLFAAASVAGSYAWSTYTGPAADVVRGSSGFTWLRPILALRLEPTRRSGARISVRADIQPRFDGLRSLNPSFGIGLSW